MTESAYPISILKALAEVRAAVPSVPKTGHNAHFNYDFSSEEDVLNAFNPHMNAAGLVVLPSVTQLLSVTDKGVYTIQMSFTLAHKDGAVWPEKLPWIAQGQDNQDKGVAKCITSGTKYFLTSLFQTVKGPDPDKDGEHRIKTLVAHVAPPPVQQVIAHPAPVAPGKPKCPACHEGAAVIAGKPEFGGGWVCYKKKGGCGHVWGKDNRPAPSSTQGASTGGTEAPPAQERAQGSPSYQALYTAMQAACNKDGLPGLSVWWRQNQAKIKALPDDDCNRISADKEEFKQVLTIGGGEPRE